MAYETVERRAGELEVGDRVLRNNVAWYVDSSATSASGDIDVTFRRTRHDPNRSFQTYAADDPVDVVVGGFPDRPRFTGAGDSGLSQAVQVWVRDVMQRGRR